MANYVQFLNHVGKPKQIYYVCGSEKGLVWRAVTKILQTLRPSKLDKIVMDCAVDDKKHVISAILTRPLTARMVVVLWNSQLLDMAWLENRVMHKQPYGQSLIVITNEDNPRDSESEFFRWVAAHGLFVECRPLTEQQIIQLLNRELKLKPEIIARITQMGLATKDILQFIDRVKLFGHFDESMLELSFLSSEADSYVNSMMAGDRRAMSYDLEPDDLATAVGLLSYNLIRLMQLRGFGEGKGAAELMALCKLQGFALKYFLSLAPNYPAYRIANLLKSMAVFDEFRRRGSTPGASKWLAAIWT